MSDGEKSPYLASEDKDVCIFRILGIFVLAILIIIYMSRPAAKDGFIRNRGENRRYVEQSGLGQR